VFPFQLMVAMLCGWLQREQQEVIAFLREENRVLKARLEGKRLRLNDSERQRLAELGHRLDRRLRGDIATIVTPDTILRLDISRINARTSAGTAGRRVRCRLFDVQNRRKPRGCQASTVAGCTRWSAARQPCHRCDS
jgi:hypothetical protein